MNNKNILVYIAILLVVMVVEGIVVGYLVRRDLDISDNNSINGVQEDISNMKTRMVPYANRTIEPNTQITMDMISYVDVPVSFLLGEYYSNVNIIVGKYSSDKATIAEGSLFYRELLTD